MKTLIKSLSVLAGITLLAGALPACQPEEGQSFAPNQTYSSPTANRNARIGRNQFIYVLTLEKTKVRLNKTIPICPGPNCPELTLPVGWPFVDDWPRYITVIPNYRERITIPVTDVVMYQLGEKMVGFQYYATNLGRTAQNFTLETPIPFTPGMQEQFQTTATSIPAGQYQTFYEPERNLYHAFIALP